MCMSFACARWSELFFYIDARYHSQVIAFGGFRFVDFFSLPKAARNAECLAKRPSRLPRASSDHSWDVTVGPGNGIRCSHLGC